MMSNNSDYVNNLLNQLAYVDLGENYAPGDNLVETLRNGGDGDLADALEAAGYGNYVIRDYENQNDSNGFAAIAIEDPATGDVGISFRGTENLPNVGDAISDIVAGDSQQRQEAINNQIDMIDNISTAVTGDSAQAQEALDFFNRNQSDTGNNYLYGHSKGGNLAMEVYVENYDNIEGVHIINPQPINWASLNRDQLAALNNGKIDATVINGDLVWLLGGVPYPVRIIENNGTLDGDFFGPHLLNSGAYDPVTGEAIIENRPYADYLIQGFLGGGLTSLISMIQGGYEIAQTGLEWIEEARRYFTEEIPEHARRFWESVQNAWQETKETGLEIIDSVADFFSDMEEAAKDWWEEHFGKGKETSRNGSSGGPCQFQVDTRQLRQTASRLSSVTRSLDSLESALGSQARSLRSITFAGTVALQASVLGIQRKTRSLERDMRDLTNALTEIAEIFDQAENRISSNAKA